MEELSLIVQTAISPFVFDPVCNKTLNKISLSIENALHEKLTNDMLDSCVVICNETNNNLYNMEKGKFNIYIKIGSFENYISIN